MATSSGNINDNDAGGFDTVRFMSFNIRFANPLDFKHSWGNRKNMVKSMIQNQADIACLQEALHSQLKDLEDLKDYRRVGVGRDDGKEKGEYVPILYNRHRFKAVEHGHFWLSETPNVPGSKGWNAKCTRMCTWALFARKPHADQPANPNLPQFYVFNTHLDHKSDQAKVEGMKLILSTIHQKCQGKIPVILTGGKLTQTFPYTREDLNHDMASKTYKLITEGEGNFTLQDTLNVSLTGHHGPTGTSCGFDLDKNNVIDYIFIHTGDRQNWSVLTHGNLGDVGKDNCPPSDHRPVVCTVLMKW